MAPLNPYLREARMSNGVANLRVVNRSLVRFALSFFLPESGTSFADSKK